MTKTTKSKWIRMVFSILVILWMVVIFLFSAQNAESSSETSSVIVDRIAAILIRDFDNLSEAIRQSRIDTLTHIVRKLAHFSEYAILGLLTFFSLPWDRIKRLPQVLIAYGIGTIYAVTDEFHQTFSDGRSPAVTDVLIDSAGVMTGILVAWLILHLVLSTAKKRLQRRNQG